MQVLISGAGIAGPSLAWWLARHGHAATLVEQAPAPRRGGYVMDFWGLGYDLAGRMGILPELLRRGYQVRELRIVNHRGRRLAGFPVTALTRALQGRYVTVARSDLAGALLRALPPEVETRFGETIAALTPTAGGVAVRLSTGEEREVDLVVGADGQHSRVRALAFGPPQAFVVYLGQKVAAFSVAGYAPRDELTYVMLSMVGGQVARFALHEDRTLFLFTYSDPDPGLPACRAAQEEAVRRRFAGAGWECDRILEAMASADDFYFDRVSQVRMGEAPGSWSRGHVTLLGDAAFCISLLGGQGSALAMIAAYVLAGELRRGPGVEAALARTQALLHLFLRAKQRMALQYASLFAPASRRAVWTRNLAMNLMRIPWVAERAAGRDFRDELTLPEY